MSKISLPALAVAAAGAGLFISAPASAQIKKVGAAYLFRMKYSKGMTLNYTMVSETPNPVGAGKRRVEGPFTLTVLNVVGGVASIKIDSGPFLMDGKPTGSAKNSMQVKMDERGKMVEGAAGATQLNGILLPEKPIKVGESFQATNKVPVGPKALTVTSRCVFNGLKTVNGRQLAELKVTVSSQGLIPTVGSGIQYLDVADGQLYSARIVQQAKTTANGKPVTIKNSLQIKRR